MSPTSTNNKVAPENAIVAMEQTQDGRTVTLTVVWLGARLDSACSIMWDFDNCQATVDAFNAAIDNGEEPPKWLFVARGAGLITAAGLRKAILVRVQVVARGGGVVGNRMIAPNTFAQHNRIGQTFIYVGINPLFVAHAVCPIAENYVLRDHRKKTTAVAEPILPPPVGHGVPLIA